jgi:hypothetical protein
MKTENRPRHVAIAKIHSGNQVAYAIEIERTNQEHAILILARNDLQKIGALDLHAFLLMLMWEVQSHLIWNLTRISRYCSSRLVIERIPMSAWLARRRCIFSSLSVGLMR